MKRIAAVFLALTVSPFLASQSALGEAVGGDDVANLITDITADHQGVDVQVGQQVVVGSGGRVGHAPRPATGSPYDAVMREACSGDAACLARWGCVGDEVAYTFFYRRNGDPIPGPYNSTCRLPDAPVLDVAAVDASVREFARRIVPDVASVTVQPPGKALVNIPTIFAAQGGSESFTESFTALDVLPVRVDLWPYRWSWTVDGRDAAVVSDNPGTAYDGTRVRTANGGLSDYYVGTTFRRTGEHSVAVTVSWTASYSAPGLGTRRVDGTITRTSPTTTFPVAEARSELIRNR